MFLMRGMRIAKSGKNIIAGVFALIFGLMIVADTGADLGIDNTNAQQNTYKIYSEGPVAGE